MYMAADQASPQQVFLDYLGYAVVIVVTDHHACSLYGSLHTGSSCLVKRLVNGYLEAGKFAASAAST